MNLPLQRCVDAVWPAAIQYGGAGVTDEPSFLRRLKQEWADKYDPLLDIEVLQEHIALERERNRVLAEQLAEALAIIADLRSQEALF